MDFKLKENIDELIKDLKPLEQEIFGSIFNNSFHGVIYKDEVEFIIQKLKIDIYEFLKMLIQFAGLYSVVPISDFKVGSVSLGNSGNIYFGANMEFTGEALVFTVHSEQSNIINALCNNETGIKILALPAEPCGLCRQFLYELDHAENIEIVLHEKTVKLRELLPFAFGPDNLGNDEKVFKHRTKNLEIENQSDEVVSQALMAAQSSYAPYSQCYSGVALKTKDGRIFTGSYVENVAFNPSVLPLEACLVNLNFNTGNFENVEKITLVEYSKSKISQISSSNALANTMFGIDVEVIKA